MTRNTAAAPDAVWRNRRRVSPCFLASSPATSWTWASSRRRTPDRTRAGESCWPGPGPSTADGAYHHPRVTQRSLRDRDQRHGVDQAVGEHEVTVARHGGVPDDISPTRDRPALKFFGPGIETDHRVRGRSGLAVPDDIVDRRDAVGLGFRAARRRPLGHLAGRGIETAKISAREVAVPDEVIAGDRDAPGA